MTTTRTYVKNGRHYYVQDLPERNPVTGRFKQKWHKLTRVDEGPAALHTALAELLGPVAGQRYLLREHLRAVPSASLWRRVVGGGELRERLVPVPRAFGRKADAERLLQVWHALLLVVVLAGFGATACQLQRASRFREIDRELDSAGLETLRFIRESDPARG
jgi:hypothetical protein